MSGTPTGTARSVLQARALYKSFAQARQRLDVLQGASLSVSENERVAILGRSGSGKSTLLHILGGLDDPDSGSVSVCGEDLTRASPGTRAGIRNRHMGFVYQFHHLLAEFSALENVTIPLRLAGVDRGTAQKRAQAMLERVDLGSRLDHRPAALSGGERQRVAVARALVAEPAVVLADEPTGNLDAHNARVVLDLMCELSEAQGCAFVIVTHDESILHRVHRAVQLHDGVLTPDPVE